MPKLSISNEEVDDLCTKLKNLEDDLSPAQALLLNTILRIAHDVTVPQEPLDKEFDGCFEPGQAAMILSYQEGAPAKQANMITRSFGAGGGPVMITCMVTP
jgi:hypothetical protein